MKLIGAAFIVAAFTAAGLLRAYDLRCHARLLAALSASLEVMRGEVSAYLAPLPETAERLSRGGPEETRGFYALLCIRLSELGEREFSELWSDCVRALTLKKQEAESLCDLGRSLGRFGAAEQLAAFDRCLASLADFTRQAEGEAASGGRMYTGLGATLGLLLAIVLI